MAVLHGLFHPAYGMVLYVDSFQAVYLINGRVLTDTADLNALTHSHIPPSAPVLYCLPAPDAVIRESW